MELKDKVYLGVITVILILSWCLMEGQSKDYHKLEEKYESLENELYELQDWYDCKVKEYNELESEYEDLYEFYEVETSSTAIAISCPALGRYVVDFNSRYIPFSYVYESILETWGVNEETETFSTIVWYEDKYELNWALENLLIDTECSYDLTIY